MVLKDHGQKYSLLGKEVIYVHRAFDIRVKFLQLRILDRLLHGGIEEDKKYELSYRLINVAQYTGSLILLSIRVLQHFG